MPYYITVGSTTKRESKVWSKTSRSMSSGGSRIIIKPRQKKSFIGVYIRNCKQIIKKSKEIVQFIGVYIRNSKEFTLEIAKKFGRSPGACPGSPGGETATVHEET